MISRQNQSFSVDMLLQHNHVNHCSHRGLDHSNWYRRKKLARLYQMVSSPVSVPVLVLNPCICVKPLADSPDRWPHSSFAGYARKGSRVDWIDYEQLLHAWTGERVVA